MLYILLASSGNLLGQTNIVSCFTVINDTTNNYTEFCVEDQSKIQQFYKDHGAIPMERALEKVGRRNEIESVTYMKYNDSENHVWSIVCDYKVSAPKRYGGFATLLKYRVIVIDAITGERLSYKRVKMLNAY